MEGFQELVKLAFSKCSEIYPLFFLLLWFDNEMIGTGSMAPVFHMKAKLRGLERISQLFFAFVDDEVLVGEGDFGLEIEDEHRDDPEATNACNDEHRGFTHSHPREQDQYKSDSQEVPKAVLEEGKEAGFVGFAHLKEGKGLK